MEVGLVVSAHGEHAVNERCGFSSAQRSCILQIPQGTYLGWAYMQVLPQVPSPLCSLLCS